MFNKHTYNFIILVLLFGVLLSTEGESAAVYIAEQVEINQDTDILSLLDRIDSANRTDIDEANRLSEQALAGLRKNPDKNLQARLLNLIAYRKILAMELNASLKDILEARRFAVDADNQKEIATSYRLEGAINTALGDFSKGVELFFRALSLQKTLSFDHTYYTLQNISITYSQMEDYANYLKYGYILLEHSDSIAGSLEQGIAYSTIGAALVGLEDYSQAKEMLAKAEAIFIAKNAIYLSTVHFVLADLEYRLGNYKQSLAILNDSIRLAQKQSYDVSRDESLSLKAKNQTKMSDISAALKTLDELVVFAVANKNPKAEQEAYRQFAQIYESQGKYQAALEAHQKFKAITDDLFNANSATKIALVGTRFEMTQKEQKIALLEAESALDKIQNTEQERANTLRGYAIAFGIIMLLTISFVLYRNERSRRLLVLQTAQLKDANRRAEDANTYKSTFLASMSHDLRTPLNAILGYSEAIQLEISGPLRNDIYSGYIKSIHDSGQLLLELINDVLDISKVEAGKYELDESAFDLTEAMERTLDMIGLLAKAKKIEIECVCPIDLPKMYADERVVVQIVNNLISNSLKFMSDYGKLLIACSQRADGGLNLSITDDGIGMTEAELEKAMRPFEQVDSDLLQGGKGTGLGLTLCLKYMELHGGKLVMSSEKGVGTIAMLHFPAERTIK